MNINGCADKVSVAFNQASDSFLIGTDLYQHLLTASIKTARGEPVMPPPCDISIMTDAYFPAEWIADIDTRITHYVRLARAGDVDAVEALRDEMEDRFGNIPSVAQSLFELTEIRIMARELGISRIQAGPKAIALTLPLPSRVLRGQPSLWPENHCHKSV